MRGPPFWWRDAGIGAHLLSPAAAIYGAVAARRLAGRGRRTGVPVVCIGNPTVGGAGKTPTALAVARKLAAAGENPVLLSRGYGGGLSPAAAGAPGARARGPGGGARPPLSLPPPQAVARAPPPGGGAGAAGPAPA